MTIQFLKKLRGRSYSRDLDDYTIDHLEGCSEEEITALEQRFSKKFPQAYREYLFLAGKHNPFFGNGNCYSFENDELENIQIEGKETLEEEGHDLKKDFWVINSLDDTQFNFFYFDEGDNPPVYAYCNICDDDKEFIDGVKLYKHSFSSYIHGRIRTGFHKGVYNVIGGIVDFIYLFKRRKKS